MGQQLGPPLPLPSRVTSSHWPALSEPTSLLKKLWEQYLLHGWLSRCKIKRNSPHQGPRKHYQVITNDGSHSKAGRPFYVLDHSTQGPGGQFRSSPEMESTHLGHSQFKWWPWSSSQLWAVVLTWTGALDAGQNRNGRPGSWEGGVPPWWWGQSGGVDASRSRRIPRVFGSSCMLDYFQNCTGSQSRPLLQPTCQGQVQRVCVGLPHQLTEHSRQQPGL